MDSDRVRTFLEIIRCGSFVAAAERLGVTQTTVSARIRALENELGRTLFVRNRSGARATAAGIDFRGYAETMLQVWERARRQVAVPADKVGLISFGGELSLWNPLLEDWMIGMRRSAPDIGIRVDVALPETLMQQIRTGILDIAVLYAPRVEVGVEVEPLFKETLVLVRSPNRPDFDGMPSVVPTDYIYVDWGEHFAQQHALCFPGWSESSVHVRLGPLALNFLLSTSGCGYFRHSAVRPHLNSGALVPVAGAPKFEYPAFAIHASGSPNAVLEPALNILRRCAAGGDLEKSA